MIVKRAKIHDFIGQTFKAVTYDKQLGRLYFKVSDDEGYVMMHDQDCCENVYLGEVIGGLTDLVNTPILHADTVTPTSSMKKNVISEGQNPAKDENTNDWAFYDFITKKGIVQLRWIEESNGYYSVTVSIRKYKLRLQRKFKKKYLTFFLFVGILYM